MAYVFKIYCPVAFTYSNRSQKNVNIVKIKVKFKFMCFFRKFLVCFIFSLLVKPVKT